MDKEKKLKRQRTKYLAMKSKKKKIKNLQNPKSNNLKTRLKPKQKLVYFMTYEAWKSIGVAPYQIPILSRYFY